MIKRIVLIMHKENVCRSHFGLIGRTALGSLSTIEVETPAWSRSAYRSLVLTLEREGLTGLTRVK
jgi:hypothetical protein